MIDVTTAGRSRHSDYFVPAHTLPQRTSPPNLRAEAAAICELAKALAEDPDATVRYVLDIAQDLCGAASAGLSLLHRHQSGEATIRWESVSGALSPHEATEAPRDARPCGLCLDVGIAIVITQPQRLFDQLASQLPAIAEVLIVPLDNGAHEPQGTLWVAHHDSQLHFDSNDLRILEQLAAQLALALKLRAQASDHGENRQALRFKDALIDEVNHRTKNTLQVAATLLSMQARASSSAPVSEALLDSAARLHVLASVHDLLHVTANSAQAVLMPQLLQSLASALQQSFGRTHPHVALSIECDPLELPAEDAVAMALLANEAVTNAYKHAFPNDSAGRITVTLHRTPENALSLRIEDTGSGFSPPASDEGMGLTLIRSFAAQLRGALDVRRREIGMGTQVTLSIAAPASR